MVFIPFDHSKLSLHENMQKSKRGGEEGGGEGGEEGEEA